MDLIKAVLDHLSFSICLDIEKIRNSRRKTILEGLRGIERGKEETMETGFLRIKEIYRGRKEH